LGEFARILSEYINPIKVLLLGAIQLRQYWVLGQKTYDFGIPGPVYNEGLLFKHNGSLSQRGGAKRRHESPNQPMFHVEHTIYALKYNAQGRYLPFAA
jgi:hypothetical protein